MNNLRFSGIEILGISACVPKNSSNNYVLGKDIITDESQLSKTIETIGIENKRIVNSTTCASDLCLIAAEKLITNLMLNKQDIDVVIFVSQTGDYILPATACIIQNKLGLSKKTLAFDINMGCSGYIYGLSVAYALASNNNINKVLLLVGDTSTKVCSKKNKSTVFLFGDAGTATVIQKTSEDKISYINLFTDGSGFEALNIKDGGFRNQTTEKSLENFIDVDNNERNALQLYMNGGEIFNFTLREVPKSINELLFANDLTLEEIDFFVFHQANKFMIDFLAKKIKIPQDKFLTSLKDFGNTSSASIPLTLVVNKSSNNYKKTLMSGFGVGLSWGNCITDLSNTKIIDLIEYES